MRHLEGETDVVALRDQVVSIVDMSGDVMRFLSNKEREQGGY